MSQVSNKSGTGGPIPGTYVETITGNSGVATAVSNNIDLVAAAGSGTFVGSGNTVTYTQSGALSDSFVTDSGTATPSAGVLDINGAHNVNTSGSGNQVIVHGNNTITVGDLASVAGSNAITVTTGNVTVTAGNLNLPNTSGSGGAGEIQFGGNRWISNFGTTNTFVGQGSGNTSLTGSQNVILGSSAGSSITNGTGNTAAGYFALNAFTGLGGNVAIGTQALSRLTTGNSNTAVGEGAGNLLLTGASNTLIGAIAGSTYTGSESNNICLASKGVIGENTTMRLGIPASGVDLTATFIGGTYGITPAVSGTNQMVISNDQGQLGTQALPSPTPINIIPITPVNNAASPYTVLITDQYLQVDVSGGAVTIELPNAPATGQIFTIKDSTGNAGTSNITVTTVGGAVTIDGATSFVMNSNYQAIDLIFDGTAYEVY